MLIICIILKGLELLFVSMLQRFFLFFSSFLFYFFFYFKFLPLWSCSSFHSYLSLSLSLSLFLPQQKALAIAWAIIRRWLDERTQSKIQVFFLSFLPLFLSSLKSFFSLFSLKKRFYMGKMSTFLCYVI